MKFNKTQLAFNNWKKKFSKKYKILKTKKLFNISRNNHNVATGYDIEFLNDSGHKIKRYIIMQGLAVQIVPLIFCTTNKKFYTIVVEQIRIGSEKKTYEFPSGSYNNLDETLKKTALREIKEELNLKIKSRDLIKLNKKPVLMQPVNSYLKCHFYYFYLKMSKKKLENLNNLKTGVSEENEYCFSKVFELNKVNNFMNDSIIIGLKLLEKKIKLIKKNL